MMLCLRCGKREQFVDNICEECILETVKPIDHPPIISEKVCPTCNRILKGKTWQECPGDLGDAACQIAASCMSMIEGARDPSIQLSVAHADSNKFNIEGESRTNYKGVLIEQELKIEVRISLSQCSFCSKQSGNYFEAIIQLRGLSGLEDDEIDDLLFHIEDATQKTHLKDPNVFITKTEKVKGGYDIYMGENAFAKQMAQKLHETYGGETKWSSSLFGRKDGRDIYRHTYLVRLPGFIVGDYLLKNDEPLKVVKISKRIMVRSLITNREISLDPGEAMSLRVMKRRDVEIDLVIVSHSEDEIQVLHPSTMRTVDLLLNGRKVTEDTLMGALIEGELYLV